MTDNILDGQQGYGISHYTNFLTLFIKGSILQNLQLLKILFQFLN